MQNEISVLIAGGCFPFQDNISSSELYHSVMKEQIECKSTRQINISLIRYNSLSGVMDQILTQSNISKPDFLIFHCRVESFLRRVKFFYRYHDSQDRVVNSFNILGKAIVFSHGNCATAGSDKQNSSQQNSPRRNILRLIGKELNYTAGIIIGNLFLPLRRTQLLLNAINSFCTLHQIKLIVTSPVPRPISFTENLTSLLLHWYLQYAVGKQDVRYMNIWRKNDTEGNFLFCDDKIRVNALGHRRIGEMLAEEIIRSTE